MILKKLFIVACIVFAAVAMPVNAGGNDDEQAIIKVVRDWEASLTNRDAAAMQKLYREDAAFFPSKQNGVYGAANIVNAIQLPPQLIMDDLRIDIDKVEVGTTLGYIYGRFWIRTHVGDNEPGVIGARYLLILKKNEAGEWQIQEDFDQRTADATADNWPS